LLRLDRRDEANAAFRRALELATAPAERAFLTRRIEETGGTPD
jgi:predicted RNA polymerase sigma factor